MAAQQRADVDSDGDVDAGDASLFTTYRNAQQGLVTGRDVLSGPGRDGVEHATGNLKGYAGYEHGLVLPTLMLARHRWYRADLGAWMSRDPVGYVDGANLYEYVGDSPVVRIDASGFSWGVCSGSCGGGDPPAPTGTSPSTPPTPLIGPPAPGPTTTQPADGQPPFEASENCKKARDELKWNHPGCPKPNVVCVGCAELDKQLPKGAHAGGITLYGDSPTILMCDKPGAPLEHFQQFLEHESVHAWDCCTFKTARDVGFNCRQRICSEIRAYAASNCKNVPPQDYSKCVSNGARQSVCAADKECCDWMKNPANARELKGIGARCVRPQGTPLAPAPPYPNANPRKPGDPFDIGPDVP